MPSFDLLGPPTEATIDPSSFARQAAQSLQTARLRQAEARSYIEKRTSSTVDGDVDVESDAQEQLRKRCSVHDLKAHTSAMYSDDYMRTCLRTFLETTWLDPHNDTDLRHLNLKSKSSLRDKLDRIKRSHVAIVNAVETSQSSSSTGPTSAGSRGNATSTDATTVNTIADDVASTTPTADPRWSKWLREHDDNTLRIAKPTVHPVFLRAPGHADLQTLTNLRPGKSVPRQPMPQSSSQGTHATGSSSTATALLSSLMYTITFQPIAPTLQPSSANAITRAQTLRVLGTTTLAELKSNIIRSGNAVPGVELSDDEDATSSPMGWDQDEDHEEREQGEQGEENSDEEERGAAVKSRKQRNPRTVRELDLALMLEPTEAARLIKWGKKRRKTGSVFGIEGALYADHSREVEGYASLIKQATSEIDWSTQKSANGATQPSIPTWFIGGRIDDIVLGSLKLRVGEPYYYLHDGSAEHIWTIDEIRQVLHTLDPSPTASVYPITSFLSRNRSLSRCYICDIDTATVITIDDELAGRSPALMCEKCFQLLHSVDQDWDHGDEDGHRKWRRIECVTEE
ncbi:BZ3501_MvSof-1269-A2-R1_Chr12-2g03486 [Microbotryum saponariae]|nr:BZ3501_MvSof-1269-A2-R1_Chr12-2g03486 [Microbotryum saponariae]